jgi:protein-S-isoprenylcysteine O-methyltransferase Ste14
MRVLFRWLAALLFIAVVVQIALAGYGAFHAVHAADHKAISQTTINNAFNPHIALGYIIVLLMLVLLVVAALGRLERSSILRASGILVLGIVQAFLGIASESVPAIGPLHALNALAILAATGALAHRTSARTSAGEAAPAT